MNWVTEEEARRIAETLYRYDNIAVERLATLDQADDKAIEFYRRNGYLVIDRLIDETEVSAALSEITEIAEGRIIGPQIVYNRSGEGAEEAVRSPERIRKINHYAAYAPTLGALTGKPTLLALLARLLGDQPCNILNQALLKPPVHGAEKPWHQDMAYGNQNYTRQTVTIWVALDDAGLDNGCMHIIPGSHLGGGMPHYQIRDWQLCDSRVDVNRDMAVPLRPGGALIFSGLLHHGTPANFSERWRRSLQLRYAPESAELMTRDAYRLMFTNELVDVDC